MMDSKNNEAPGFTLIELLVSIVILMILLGTLMSMTNYALKGVQYASAKIESFQSARFAFESITRAVSSATLNTYYDYYDASRNRRTPLNASSFQPAIYGRYSELEFVTGKNLIDSPRAQITHAIFFQSPINYSSPSSDYSKLQGLLNVLGFYIEFYNDSDSRPLFVTAAPRWRYRLMELVQPTENFSVYESTGHSWFKTPIDTSKTAAPPVRVIAENIIACVICPRLPSDTDGASSLTSNYEYDTNIANTSPSIAWTSGTQPICMNQLPPLVRIALVAVDEQSMIRIQGKSTGQPDFGFDYAQVFQVPNKLDDDLETVSKALEKKHVTFRIFQTDVAILGAKWSP